MGSDNAAQGYGGCARQCRLRIRSLCVQYGLWRLRGLFSVLAFLALVCLGVYVVHYVLESRGPPRRGQLGGHAGLEGADLNRFPPNRNRAKPRHPPARRGGQQRGAAYDVYRPDPDRGEEYDYPAADRRTWKEEKDPGARSPEKSSSSSNPLYLEPEQALSRQFRSMARLVHLDLKGAPPSLAYLEKLLPLVRQAGATGLLVEYEDSFPYSGNLSVLAAENAYTVQDVAGLRRLARENELEVIPLVPTFGHMEFVLKHPEFAHLRETASNPQAITPARKESYSLIRAMITQVVEAHPDSHFLHIGCDEVYELGKGQSNNMMVSSGLSREDVFLMHVKAVAGLVREAFQQLKCIMWDDHLRKIPLDKLQGAGLASLVEPMVWAYTPDIRGRVSPTVWKKYGRVFPHVWVASAFKGATGVVQYITNASYHLQNHYSWINTVKEHSLLRHEVKVRGMAITGWQRYDHFAALCELLPVAVPSLLACLSAFRHGGFGQEQHLYASKMLSCSAPVELDLPQVINREAVITQDCAFPGSDLFYAVRQLWGVVNKYDSDRGLQERIRGWLTSAHVRREFSSPGQMKTLAGKLSRTMDRLRSLREPLRSSILRYFDKSTAEEWLELNIEQRLTNLGALLNKTQRMLSRKTWGQRTAERATAAPAAVANLRQRRGGHLQGQQGRIPRGPGVPGRVPNAGRGNLPVAVQPQRPATAALHPLNPGGIRPLGGRGANFKPNVQGALHGGLPGKGYKQAAAGAPNGGKASQQGKGLGRPGRPGHGQRNLPLKGQGHGGGGQGKARAPAGHVLERRSPKGDKKERKRGGKSPANLSLGVAADAKSQSGKMKSFGPIGSQDVTLRPNVVRGEPRIAAGAGGGGGGNDTAPEGLRDVLLMDGSRRGGKNGDVHV